MRTGSMTRSTSPPQIQNKSKLCQECYIAETSEKKFILS
ncbi:hypothetical protein UUU_10660 [Klebsiella pneumoniae subsp. pneumoniae DSM 30104 = JCM 1662 = NBRC 14940]|nr:hypothetical protein UUU_10660 [Klebsiella pneumoniae subsp. pneumoniae DSM 30104 = JCM 1662 = NBRC 14940]